MWEKTNFYFENTNFLLKDADLILLLFFFLKKTIRFFIKNRPNFYLEKMQVGFFY